MRRSATTSPRRVSRTGSLSRRPASSATPSRCRRSWRSCIGHRSGRSQDQRALEINPDHALVKGLNEAFAASADHSELEPTAQLIYGMAVLAEGGDLPDPAGFAKLLAATLTAAITTWYGPPVEVRRARSLRARHTPTGRAGAPQPAAVGQVRGLPAADGADCGVVGAVGGADVPVFARGEAEQARPLGVGGGDIVVLAGSDEEECDGGVIPQISAIVRISRLIPCGSGRIARSTVLWGGDRPIVRIEKCEPERGVGERQVALRRSQSSRRSATVDSVRVS